jgi:adenosylcobinamide-phosphate synthase
MPHAARARWALATDLLLGEPPAVAHPTVWMGRALGRARGWHARAGRSPTASYVAGATAVGTLALAVGLLAALAEGRLARVPGAARAAAAGALLKPALSLRALVGAGREVEHALRRGDLPEARRLLAWHLVSRDTTRLSASEVAGAAIESLAENLSDGLVAPLLYHAVGGLAGAYVYRLVNTADAMLGYRTPELEWFGKAAARADDALNLLPARVTALLIALAAGAGSGSTRAAVRVALADARRTPSPNAGWPMAAMAGALDVRLDKRAAPGAPAVAPRVAPRPVYVLHAHGRAPGVADLARAGRIVAAAAALAVAVAHASVARPRRIA